ncbi:hypothetical protein AAG604_04170 [Citromicrobium bathyomarinum]
MADPFGKRSLMIAGKSLDYDDINDLAVDIEVGQSNLRMAHSLITDDVDKPTLDRIHTKAQAQRDRIKAYTAWLEEQRTAEKAAIAELRQALRDLPSSPFEGQ